MPSFVDARIPILFGVAPGQDDAVFQPVGGALHVPGCACCVARSPDARALDRLFLQRVRGEVPWFTRVVVARDDDGLRQAVLHDPIVSMRFRLA